MPDFLKRLLLLTAISAIGWKIVSLNIAHHFLGALLALVITLIADLAVWKWEFG